MEYEQNKLSINEKLNFFLNKKIKVHITRHNKEYLNGLLISKESEGIFILEEDKKGKMYIFLSEIFDAEEYLEKNEQQ